MQTAYSVQDLAPSAGEPLLSLHRLGDALRASYDNPTLTFTLKPKQRVDVLSGERVALELLASGCQRTFTLTRTPPLPPGSGKAERAGSLEAGRFMATVPGLYVVRLTIDGCYHRDVEIVALPAEAIRSVGLSESTGMARRIRVRSITRDPAVTPETIAAALETGEKFRGGESFSVLVGRPADSPFPANNYGAG